MDCLTLLATPHQKTTESKCGGNYKYYGLEEGIRGFLSLMDSNDVHLTVNIDGIPLFKSSGLQFWPILVKCGRFDPVIVAMFCGKGKPSPLDDFLDDFLKEYKSIKDNGVLYEGQTYNINIDALICDAPARAMRHTRAVNDVRSKVPGWREEWCFGIKKPLYGLMMVLPECNTGTTKLTSAPSFPQEFLM